MNTTDDHLKFVEEHAQSGMTRFEKVLVASKRAKDIYDEVGLNYTIKPTYRAILEVNEGRIKLAYTNPVEDEASES